MRRELLTWARSLGRSLAIRDLREPWAALVVEVMSQQTQISRVEERAPAFLARFPTAAALAEASTGELLRAWAGLGYNRRAIALRDAARAIVADHGGRVPPDLDALLSLPGLGPYTARAVAVRAFGVPVAALDVNVGRVVRRVLGWQPAGRPRELQAQADALVDPADPAGWTDAVMDLAVSLCAARAPRCDACPVRRWCATGSAASAPDGRLVPAVPAPERPPRDRTPYPATRRWLRGRLVAELRAADDGTWLRVDGPRGEHAVAEVAAVLRDLEREGIVELHPEHGARLR